MSKNQSIKTTCKQVPFIKMTFLIATVPVLAYSTFALFEYVNAYSNTEFSGKYNRRDFLSISINDDTTTVLSKLGEPIVIEDSWDDDSDEVWCYSRQIHYTGDWLTREILIDKRSKKVVRKIFAMNYD